MASFAEIHKSSIIDTLTSDVSTFEDDKHHTDKEMILRIEYRRYIRNKLLYDCLSECIDDLDLEIGEKLEGIMNNIKLRQYLKLGNQSLLGLSLSNSELSYQEAEDVKSFVQKKVWEKRTKTNEEFKNITSKDFNQVAFSPKPTIALHDLTLSQEDESIISYKEKLIRVQDLFIKNVSIRNKLLQELLDLRLHKVPEMCEQTKNYCKAVIESNDLKAKIAEFKMKKDIFMEIPNAIDAYHQLIRDIKKQQDDCETCIEKMKDLKRKYENISGRDFDEILKSYLMYKSSLDKLNQMYELVKDSK